MHSDKIKLHSEAAQLYFAGDVSVRKKTDSSMKKISFTLMIVCCVSSCAPFPAVPGGYYPSSPTSGTYSTPTGGNDLCTLIVGAIVVGDDGKYLGKISNRYDSESIFNEHGTYGSQYSSESIWNEYGSYGGKYSTLSPFNSYTTTPPKLVKEGQIIANLTTNQYLEAPLNPYVLKSCAF